MSIGSNGRDGSSSIAAGGLANHRTHVIQPLLVGDHQAHWLEACDLRDHLGVDRRHDIELAGPRVEIMWPCEVAREVRRPLGGHPVAREQAAMFRSNIGHSYER